MKYKITNYIFIAAVCMNCSIYPMTEETNLEEYNKLKTANEECRNINNPLIKTNCKELEKEFEELSSKLKTKKNSKPERHTQILIHSINNFDTGCHGVPDGPALASCCSSRGDSTPGCR